ncbi:MAG: UrcA family protein [Novosphingobium sp.]
MMKTAFAALAVLSLATPAVAASENPLAQDETVLRLDGIDLSTADGQQRLAIRMDAAARTVCGDRLATVHLALNEQARACRAEVVADIRNKIEARQASAAGSSRVQLASAR